MTKESAVYTEHVLDLFTEILHRRIIIEPLQDTGMDITPSLAQALQYLLRHEVCSVRDIAKGLSMTYSAASQLTDRLVKKELATKCEDEQDRRLSAVRLTEKGRKLVEEIRHRRAESMAHILQRMDSSNSSLLVKTMESFIAAAVEDEERALETCSHCGKDHVPDCVVNEIYRAATGTPIEQI